MEGLAKSAPQTVNVPVAEPANTAVTKDGATTAGFPEHFLYSLGIDYGQSRDFTETDTKRIQEIYDYAMKKSDEKTLGNAIKVIRDLEIHLGTPSRGETKLSKIWGYIHINNKIRDLEVVREQMARRY